ncbi:MAG TPA: PilZ domain-containing protein [Saccharospirillum sp.]|nr:PilZ domain-containing protein [Saccharospirillum sp.]
MDTDRREFFRVADTAYVTAAGYDPARPAIADYFPELHQVAVLKEFENVDAQFGEFLERIKDPATHKLMDLFNTKLRLMTRYLHIQTTQAEHLQAQPIDISEGGCQCWLEGKHEVGEDLALALIFSPSYLSLFCHARIAEARAEGSGTRVNVEFQSLNETQRQSLTRHLFKVQAQNRS